MILHNQCLYIFILISLVFLTQMNAENNPYIIVLGTAQDGGIPHSGCEEKCCTDKWNDPSKHGKVASLAIVNPKSNEAWMIDATPDFPSQLNALTSIHSAELKGIFLTHAHIGHYTGLIHLGKEVMGSKMMHIYAMPRLKSFLENNGPWSQLVALNNIMISKLQDGEPVKLTDHISVTPFTVPHRDEFSETVGYRISGLDREIIYIPDIDKWDLWRNSIVDEVKSVDYAFLDATFFSGDEINRSMSEIPHSFVLETIDIFMDEDLGTKNKIHFIHFNHTNPLLNQKINLRDSILKLGFNFAKFGDKYDL